ncbi:acetyltransferase [Fonticula alba]|uniref:Acetyltransferase n=1 Tax=Fonticula alba TaxID=691883 RepID=A0A058Z881_FONAL|nr:acetyltransferase [Fonticula alba]KCV70479.1 acetyltransferase [Fonticula alba]|eukprot:XP_009494995.1 acetyltransferase [Fonticula alba]
MTTIRPFRAEDLFETNLINLDHLTENYNVSFYFTYLASWPELFTAAVSSDNTMMAYVMGKVEGKGTLWHGHVTAITVAPIYRRLGLAASLMHSLEEISEKFHDTYFVDLFVRTTNAVAINMYKKLGYTIYRRVIGYYSKSDDAYDMRRACARDPKGLSVIPMTRPVYPHEINFD